MPIFTVLALLAVARGPYETIKRFVHAMNVSDEATIANLTLGRKANLVRLRAKGLETERGGDVKTWDPKVRMIGDSAVVSAKFRFGGGANSYTQTEWTTLKRTGGTWKVLPAHGFGYAGFISKEARVASGEDTIPPNLPYGGSQRLAHVKEFVSILETYLINHDFRIKFTEAGTRQNLAPYLDPDYTLTSPFDPRGGLHANFQMSGKRIIDTRAPGITIMVYEGSHGKLNFSHGGKATVGFVDGHVELVTRNDLKSLLWNI